MRRNISLIFILLFLVVFSSFAQQREVKPVQLGLIAEGLYEILEGRGARGGAYIGDNCVLIIDAKMTKESVEQTIAEIQKVTDKPIKYLVNTHSDGDHITGNRYFPETVTFIAHQNCRQELFHPSRDGKPSDWAKPELAPFLPAITFRDKMDIYLGQKKAELWYFGRGHTTGDAVVYFPLEKVAFLGDQIFVTRPQLIHSYKGGDSFEHVKTLTKMLNTLEAEKFCSGHSDPVDRQTIQKHIETMKTIQEKIKALVAKGKNLEEIKSEFQENEGRLVEAIYNEIKKSIRNGDDVKKSLGAKTLLLPTPVWVIGSYDKEGKPNVMTCAWAGICCSKPPCVMISLRKATYTFGNIKERNAFTVNIPSKSFAEVTAYFGSASGKDVDKFSSTGLTPIKSDLVDAPYIDEFPLVIECKLLRTIELGLHTMFIGEIMDVKANESILGEIDSPDIEKLKPFVFVPGSRDFYRTGEYLGKVSSLAKKFDKK